MEYMPLYAHIDPPNHPNVGILWHTWSVWVSDQSMNSEAATHSARTTFGNRGGFTAGGVDRVPSPRALPILLERSPVSVRAATPWKGGWGVRHGDADHSQSSK